MAIIHPSVDPQAPAITALVSRRRVYEILEVATSGDRASRLVDNLLVALIVVSVAGVSMIAVPAGLMASRLTDELRRRRENYQELVEDNLEDGIITEEENRAMQEKRQTLGISEEDAAAIARHAVRELSAMASCPHCGASIGN